MVQRRRVGWLILGCAAAFPTVASAQSTAGTAASPPGERTHAPLEVQALRPGLSVIRGAGANVVVWSGPDGVLLVDSGLEASAAELHETVARVAPGPLRFVVNTHGHADHTGGNELAAGKGAVLIAHERLRDILPAPAIATVDGLSVLLNGDRLDVVHVADAHTASDLVLRWAQADVVALGGLFWNGQYPHIDLDAGGSLAGTVAALESVLARTHARTVIVPGHGPVATRAELAAHRDMLVAVGRRVREAVERGDSLEAVLATHPTASFDARYAPADAAVSPAAFVATVYADLTTRRR